MVADGESVGAGGLELPPMAPLLMQSLRSVGYTTASAIADLVDNSIGAGARRISIRFSPVPSPHIAVVDDGEAMSADDIVAAMRFGSRDPRESRSDKDLGRFGLGLKTASLSQCRRMTVASLKGGELSMAAWDLDECDRRGTWWLERPSEHRAVPGVVELLRQYGKGTAVVWEKLDRLLPVGTLDQQATLDRAMEGTADHLALAFHRFLAGEFGDALELDINARPLPHLDPFLAGHPRGQGLHEERFEVQGRTVKVSPFVLPFPSRLDAADLAKAGGRENVKSAHGFYIYRGGRLVVPGGWFRIVPADELVRLARIRVDVPVELDHIWKIDVRKTMAEPPHALRPGLKRIVGDVTRRSRMVYSYRGTPKDSDIVSAWGRHDLRNGAAAWRINREHPMIAALLSSSNPEVDIRRALDLLEQSLPLHDIYIHISNDQPVAEPDVPSEEDLQVMAIRLLDAFQGLPAARARLLAKLCVTDPFNRNPEAAARIAERLAS